MCVYGRLRFWAEDSRRGTHSLRPVGGLCLARERRFVAEVDDVVFDSHAASIPNSTLSPSALLSGLANHPLTSLAGSWKRSGYSHNAQSQTASLPPYTPTWLLTLGALSPRSDPGLQVSLVLGSSRASPHGMESVPQPGTVASVIGRRGALPRFEPSQGSTRCGPRGAGGR